MTTDRKSHGLRAFVVPQSRAVKVLLSSTQSLFYHKFTIRTDGGSATRDLMNRFKHPAFTWLVMHSADVVNRFFVHVDGQASFEKSRVGSSGELFEFGLCIMNNVSVKPQGAT